jgi:hypothetical protein
LYGLLDNCIEEFAATEVVLGCAHGFYDPDQEGIEIWENVPHSKAALVKLDEKSELAELAEVELDIQYSHLGKDFAISKVIPKTECKCYSILPSNPDLGVIPKVLDSEGLSGADVWIYDKNGSQHTGHYSGMNTLVGWIRVRSTSQDGQPFSTDGDSGAILWRHHDGKDKPLAMVLGLTVNNETYCLSLAAVAQSLHPFTLEILPCSSHRVPSQVRPDSTSSSSSSSDTSSSSSYGSIGKGMGPAREIAGSLAASSSRSSAATAHESPMFPNGFRPSWKKGPKGLWDD